MSAEINLSDKADSLSRVSMFRRLSPAELEQLAEAVDQVDYRAGQIIFNEQDKGDALYVVESGLVSIWVRDEDVKPVTLAELKPGDFFGEMAVLDRAARSTSATAVEDTVLHRLSSDDFQKFLMDHPDAAIDVICELGVRLRQTNALVSQRVTRNVNDEMEERSTLGARVADKVASFGGSWRFIFLFLGFLLTWVIINSLVLVYYSRGESGASFDPYPYILLNLMLSMTAALQAPIIMMSQNRAAEKDRLAAEQDFKVNLKSEVMLEELTRKSREREEQLDELIALVKEMRQPTSKP